MRHMPWSWLQLGMGAAAAKSESMILSDTWKMRNAKLMTCRKSLASVTTDGLNKHQDKSESNSTNLNKRPSILVLQPSFSSLPSPFLCFDRTESRAEKVSFIQDARSQSRPSLHWGRGQWEMKEVLEPIKSAWTPLRHKKPNWSCANLLKFSDS